MVSTKPKGPARLPKTPRLQTIFSHAIAPGIGRKNQSNLARLLEGPATGSELSTFRLILATTALKSCSSAVITRSSAASTQSSSAPSAWLSSVFSEASELASASLRSIDSGGAELASASLRSIDSGGGLAS